MPSSPRSFAEYCAAANPAQRAALQRLRQTILAAAPGAEDCVSYGLPAFCLNGKPLVALGAGKSHCSLYPMNSTTIAAFKGALKGFETSKGAIRFQPERPLPALLVRKLIKARVADCTSQPVRRPAAKESRADPAVTAFISGLKPPQQPVLQAIRRTILAVSPRVREGIKWNSPSFRTSEWFATANVHGTDTIRLILHRGAKSRAGSVDVPDPASLLQWLGKDRAMVVFRAGKGHAAIFKPLKALLRHWIKQV